MKWRPRRRMTRLPRGANASRRKPKVCTGHQPEQYGGVGYRSGRCAYCWVINLPTEVSEAIYKLAARRAKRSRVVIAHKRQEERKNCAAADYEVTKLPAEAERQGRIMRGEGDAEAAKLFADAFSQTLISTRSFVVCALREAKSFEGNQT